MQAVTPHVRLIAHTQTLPGAMIEATGGEWKPKAIPADPPMDSLAEFAGRACYQSWTRPNPLTASLQGYLRHILEVGHYSLLRHASCTFYITGVSRALTHELVVHKHLAHSQLSQRYVPDHGTYVVPPDMRDDPWSEALLAGAIGHASRDYESLVEHLEGEQELPRKRARQAARSVLPNATETKLVVTGNLQAWRQFIAVRWSDHADEEIREVAGQVLQHLRRLAPHSVQDLPDRPYATEGVSRPLDGDQQVRLSQLLEARGVDRDDIEVVLARLSRPE